MAWKKLGRENKASQLEALRSLYGNSSQLDSNDEIKPRSKPDINPGRVLNGNQESGSESEGNSSSS